jgi:hypothetical protein
MMTMDAKEMPKSWSTIVPSTEGTAAVPSWATAADRSVERSTTIPRENKSMNRIRLATIGVLALGFSLAAVLWAGAPQPVAMKTPAPELQDIDEWINSKPMTLKELKGKVVVLHFWTFG